jgi:hypothetical protein
MGTSTATMGGTMAAALSRLNVTDEELLRIRNRCEGVDGKTDIWAPMLQMLVDHIRLLRSIAKAGA